MTTKIYNTPREWIKANRAELKKYKGEWIAFTKEGVLFHDKKGATTLQLANDSGADFVLRYVHPYEFSHVVRILPIRIKSLKKHDWVPFYDIKVGTKKLKTSVQFLVDSGADITVIPYFLGKSLGLTLSESERPLQAEGVNGRIDYVVRYLYFDIDGFQLEAPVGWIQTDAVDDILLGREVIFDFFDVEFKQKDEEILFKKRNDIA